VLISCSTPIKVARQHTNERYKIYTLYSFFVRTDEMHLKSRRAKLEYSRPISSIFQLVVRPSKDVRLVSLLNKKAVLSQRWPRDAPYICVTVCPENFRDSL